MQLAWAGIGARIERKIDLTFNDVSVVSMRIICTVLGSGEVVSRSVSNQRIDEGCRGRYTVAYVLISCLSQQEWRVFSHHVLVVCVGWLQKTQFFEICFSLVAGVL